MTDKDKIKFAIRYLKKGLKSKRTPPLYEELMRELWFVSEKELGKVEGKLADLTSEYYELENFKNNEIAELKEQISTKDILIKELQEQKVYWKESSFDWRRNFFKKGSTKRLVKKSKQLSYAKELIRNLLRVTYGEGWNYSLQVKVEAEQFLKECE